LATGPPSGDPIYDAASRHDGPVALVTTHRRESWGSPMEATASAVRWLADAEHDLLIVLPLHPNPAVQATLRRVLDDHERVILCPPLRYKTMAHVLAASAVVLTDSGGIQEEAPSLGKPVLVMREKTERPEGLAAGTSRLVGVERQSIVDQASLLLRSPQEYAKMTGHPNPYGDGRASERIAAHIKTFLGR
jgi:UDP-N-acetylglucosamine 2-epimerase (non-hydrolysing)